MKVTTSIQFKAFFLLVVFALNTVVGFACSVAMGKVFNSSPLETEQLIDEPIDFRGETVEPSCHGNKGSRFKKESRYKNNSAIQGKSKPEKGNCCSNKVKTFQQVDKLLNDRAGVVYPAFFSVLPARPYITRSLHHSNIARTIRLFVQSHHPPIPDIRVAIQSFQV